ncbi:MAG: endonuclease endonuclease [Parcubacteria group bacterium]|nr:endonuclease endonuclease [Parcubacteria group bacterium]
MSSGFPVLSTQEERRARAKKIVAYLKKAYAIPKTELAYKTPFQLVVSVMLSAQCTDKKVNAVTEKLFKKYKSVNDFANADWATLSEETSSITYHRTKAKHIIASAQLVRDEFKGKIPKTEEELIRLPGVAYKTAHVVLGELHNIWEGIPTDTHVRRFALRFDLTSHTELTKISKDLEELIPKADWKFVNNGLVLYGRYVCNAIPHECSKHPLTKIWPPAAHRWPKAK